MLQQWQKSQLCYQVDYAIEALQQAELAQALTLAKAHYFQSYTLHIAQDFCLLRTVMVDNIWQKHEDSVDFIEEVKLELADEIHQIEEYWIDAKIQQETPEGLEVLACLLPKLKTYPYLKACQLKKMRLKAILVCQDPAQPKQMHEPLQTHHDYDVLPWRQKQLAKQKYLRTVRLSLPSLLVLLIGFIALSQQNNLLTQQQKTAVRLQKQEAQYLAANPDMPHLSNILPLFNLMPHLETVKIDAMGQATVSGRSKSTLAVSPFLETLEEQHVFEPGSLHDLQVHDEKGQVIWQASFELARDTR